MQNNSINESESIANYKKDALDQTFRDAVSTISKEGNRNYVVPQKPKGRLYNLRSYFSYFYLILFFTLPFIKVEGEPLFLFNVLERKFIFFSKIFWPQDFFIFAIGLLTFIVFVILFTVAFGRIFCGWACPQTIFMEMVFRKIEYFIDGDANQQKKLKAMPWNTEKVVKRVTKIFVFFSLSFLIANFFLGYIIGIDEVGVLIKEGIFVHFGTFSALVIFTLVFFFVYYWFREQACIIVCPYGRLQGVLLDRNSILVAYDYVRGEPRGKLSDTSTSKGDCVNCHACVRVCPTGIDIRNGTQLECVNCTACIDACDEIMDHVNKPKGLIRYASENGIALKEKMTYTWRLKLYTLVLSLLLIFLGVLLVTRADVAARIMRTPGQTYQLLADDKISNLYNIKLVNKTRKNIHLDLKLENIKGEINQVGVVDVPKESYFQTSFFITLKNEQLKARKTKVKIGIYENGKKMDVLTAIFLGPSI
ncbi:MAG TPA: cytochrome c oxidase accessory protein CcoG [Chitinophagaceae bacterium]|nr:cytochrome c oxidase accessory protein CcoG [Chitinophagaceae bacterium]